MKIVKEETNYSSTYTDKNSAILLRDAKVLKYLISSWSGSGRLVCVDSSFASVQATEVTEQEGLKFIMTVKTAINIFIMTNLQTIEVQKRVDRVGLVRRKDEGNCDLLSFAWMDRKRRYLICSSFSMSDEEPNIRRN